MSTTADPFRNEPYLIATRLKKILTAAGLTKEKEGSLHHEDMEEALTRLEIRLAAKPVLQSWVCGLSFMQQSVILTNIRGVDGARKYDPPKMLLRWFRRCVLLSAMDQCVLTDPVDPRGGSFTGPSIGAVYDPRWHAFRQFWGSLMDSHVSEYIKESDAIPHHFQMHFLHAAEILGYKHPVDEIRSWWLQNVYNRLVNTMHLTPESESDMDKRLGDNREQWLERNDAATVK